MKMNYWITAGALVLAACRPDPGPNDYASQEPFEFPDEDAGGGASSNVLPGPNPYVPGERRLSINFAYEGEASELVAIDNTTTHLYVYEETLVLNTSNDRIEGTSAFEVELTGSPWWGMGVHWDNPRDLSDWDTLHISFRSSDAAFDQIEIGVNDSVGTKSVMATDYGWAPDGEWHSLEIPVSDFEDAGLATDDIAAALVLQGGAGSGETLLVDDVYYSIE